MTAHSHRGRCRSAGPYPIVIGPGALATLPRLLDQSALGPRRVIVSSPLVWQLHGKAIRKASTEREPILVPDGERFKTTATVGRVYEALLQLGADRSTVIIAVGGGVIGDLVGFAAATYLRGSAPRARSDHADGPGRQRCRRQDRRQSHARQKPDRRVSCAAPGAGRSRPCWPRLPRREFRAGLYEVIKYGIIASPTLFERVGSSLPALFAREPDAAVGHRVRNRAASRPKWFQRTSASRVSDAF